MSYTLVLVGGTGQRFGLGLGYLNLLGIARMPDRVVVVDAEGASGTNPTTIAAKKLLQFGQASTRYQQFRPYPGRSAGDRDLTVTQCVDTGGSELFPLCYGEDEARLAISEGFYATPKLAAPVFAELLTSSNELFNEEFQDGAAVADARRNVIVVGSVAGGTGAGILRALASAYRRGNNRVLGIVFGRYFDLPGGRPPSSEDLDRNARVGCDFLLNADAASPFDVLVMVGPPPGAPLPAPVASDRALPHSFPGLLAALSVVTDGGDDLVTRYDQARTNHPKDQPQLRLDLAFGACGQGEQLRDTDVWFPTQDARGTRSYISLADARAAAREARQALAAWREFPFERAHARSALFVERKLGGRICEALRSWSATGHIHAADATQLWEQLAGKGGARGAIGAAEDGLASFETWLANVAETRALACRAAGSADLTPHGWRAALGRSSVALPREQIDVLAQAWCIAVARAQWKGRQQRASTGDGGRWLFGYATTGCSAAPGELARLTTRVEVTEVESRSYPTPFGQAHAFAKRIELGDAAALRDAETLWLALCAGWLQIDIRNLGASTSRFDRVAAQIDASTRFTGLVRVRKAAELPAGVAALGGKLVGASHPTCGLWPGVRDDIRATLRALDDALDADQRSIARRVLRRWKDALVLAIGTPKVAWWRAIRDATQRGDDEPAIEMADIRTRGPLLLAVDADRPRPLYVYVHEPRRAARCSQLLAVLADGPRLDSNTVVYRGQDIARIQRRHVTDDEQRFDRAATIEAGHLELDFLEADLHDLPAKALAVDEILIDKVGVPSEILASWADGSGEATSPLRPDLTWRRTVSSRGPRDIIDVNLPARGRHVLRLHEEYADAPDVPDVAYHPGRHAWVVWLRDPVTNPNGSCQRVSGTTVRVHQDKRTWLVRFPDNSEIAEPQRIFSVEGYRLVSRTGPVLPALPVQHHALDLVQCDDELKPAELRGNRLWFRFRLFGGLEVAYSLDPASLVDEDRLHIELWPNLPHARWRRFWLGVEADVVPTAYEYHVYARSPHGYYEPQTRFGGAGDAVRAAHYVSVTGRPRLLWIGTPGKGAGFLAFPDGGRAGNGKPHEATVAVDFGTFRTALLVAVSPGKSELPWPAEGRARLPGHRRTLVDNEDKAPGQRTNRSLFPPTQGPAPAPAAANAVTAGVFGAAIVFPGPDLPGADSVPFQDFSLLDQLPGRLRQYPATAEQNRTGLKWGDDDMTTAARTGYLKAVLLLGAVEAFSLGATVLDVRYSFPLAYELRDALHRSFVEAAAWIERDVLGGLDGAEPAVRLQDPDSESSAGMIAAEAYEDWIVTLDLGGGTLDLGIYHQDTDRPREPVAWDSVRLGADLVTAAYVANTKREPTTVRVELLSGTFKYDNEPLIKDSDRLFQLAMEYAARLVAGTLRTRDERPTGAKVTVVLLGSGWRWDRCRTGSAKFDAESFEHRYGAQMQQRIEQLAPGLVQRVQIHTGLLDREREKLAVAHGLARGTSELRKVRDTIRAPNGLDESGHAWDRMVHQKQAFGTPSAIDARPAFPRELESVAPFNVRLQHTDVSQSILSRLRSETHPTDRYRKRTALGVAYEYMTASWFKR